MVAEHRNQWSLGLSIRRALPFITTFILVAIPLGLVLWQPAKEWGAKQLFCLCVKESTGAEVEWDTCLIEGSAMTLTKPRIYWEEKPVISNPTSSFWWKFLFSSLSIEIKEGLIDLYGSDMEPVVLQGFISFKKGDLGFKKGEAHLNLHWSRQEPLTADAMNWPLHTLLSFVPFPIESLQGIWNGSLSWHHQNPSPMHIESLEIVCPSYSIEIPTLVAELEIFKEHNVITSYSPSPCHIKTDYGVFNFMGFSTSYHSLSNKHQVAEWETVLMPNDYFSKPVPILGSITRRSEGPYKGEVIFKGDELVGAIHLNETQNFSLILSPCGTPPFSIEGEHNGETIEGSLTLHEKSCKVHYTFSPTTLLGELSAQHIPLYQFDHYFSFPIDLDEMEATLSFSGQISPKKVQIEYLVEQPKLTNDYISIFFNEPLKGTYELSFPNLLQKTEVFFKKGFLFDQESHLVFQQLSGSLCMDDFGIYLKNTRGECRGFSFVIDSKYEEGQITVYPRSLSGTISDLQRVIKPLGFPEWITTLPIEGYIIGKGDDQGWVRDKDAIWSGELNGEIFDGFTTKKLFSHQVHSLNCDYNWNFGEHSFNIEHLNAKIRDSRGDEYAIFSAPLSLAGSERAPIFFDFWVTDDQEDLLRVAGSWKSDPGTSSLWFNLNPKLTHIGTIAPRECSFTLKGWEEFVEARCLVDIPAPIFTKEVKRLFKHASMPLIEFLVSPLHSLKPVGSLYAEIEYDGLVTSACVKGKGLFKEDNNPFHLLFTGFQKGDFWEIEECTIDTLSLSGEIGKNADGYSIEFLGLELDSWVVCGCQGSYNNKNNTLLLTAPLTLVDTGVLSHLYSLPLSGFWRGKANARVSLNPFNVSITGKGQFEDLSFGPFEVSNKTPNSFEISSVPHGIELKTPQAEVVFQFEKDLCRYITGKGESFRISAENINNQWKSSLTCNLETILSPTYPLHGGKMLVEGNLNQDSFKGEVQLKNAWLYNGYIDHIQTFVDYTHNEWNAKELQVQDLHLNLLVPQITCKKKDASWQLFIPRISGGNIFPMQLFEMFFQKPGSHPLKIESFAFRDLTSVFPFENWSGSGSLEFCHLFPLDETPKIHIPKEQLSTILSVDPKWLLPSSGEVDFSFSDNLIRVEKFKDFYSEGKGIRFELLPGEKPATISWNGAWYLPLKLKPHNLPMKWVEMVTLTLTGDFQDPHLQWNAKK